MDNREQQASTSRNGTGLVAVALGALMFAAAGTTAAYWVHSRGAEASFKPAVSTTEPKQPVSGPPVTAPSPSGPQPIHTDIYFEFKSTRLTADAVRLLQDKAALMETTSTWAVLVQGYADRQGPAEYNKLLARRRAEAVKQFLVELGVPEPSVKVVAVGPDGAVCDEPTRECQQLNRRVHLEIRKLTRAAAVPVQPVKAQGDELVPNVNDQP